MQPIETWALATVALFAKSFVTVNLQGRVRLARQVFTRPEDAQFFGHGRPASERDVALVERAQGVLRNDGENTPYFLAISLAYAWLGCWPAGFAPCVWLWVTSRYVHTALYLWPRQPHRTLAFGVGLLTLVVMSVQVVWHVAAG